jgi:hypothetical protein
MLLKKLLHQPSARSRILEECLTESVHLNNLAALIEAAVGGFRAKVAWDLVTRPHYAYGLLEAADQARQAGLDSCTAVEFGVAGGEGLLNLCVLAERVNAATGVKVRIAGFDTGQGMPPPVDWRDHPEQFGAGDFPMDRERLSGRLPPNCRLILGPVDETVPEFLGGALTPSAPLSFVAFDLDYYSSTKRALVLPADPDPAKYLFLPILYFDDIVLPLLLRLGRRIVGNQRVQRETRDAQDSAVPLPALASFLQKHALDRSNFFAALIRPSAPEYSSPPAADAERVPPTS